MCINTLNTYGIHTVPNVPNNLADHRRPSGPNRRMSGVMGLPVCRTGDACRIGDPRRRVWGCNRLSKGALCRPC